MESQDLIYLVSCAVNELTPDPERIAGMDLDAVYQLASRHCLRAAAAFALEAAGVRDERFVRGKQSALLKNATMDMEMETLFHSMERAGIWYLPLKGIVLQYRYPAYGMREMSDHDILFDADRAEEVRAILEAQGFQTKEFGSSNHDVYYKRPVSNFEMHRTLFEADHPDHDEALYAYYQNVRERLLGEGCEKQLSPEDFYLYMIAHEYAHYADKGTGLRSLLDTYVLLKDQTIDMTYVASEAEKLGIVAFERDNRALAQHLFSGAELTEREGEMLEYILSSGVYGTVRHQVENRMAKHGRGKFLYLLSRFFVPISRKNKNYASFAKEYPFFYRHKILLLFLPFYRVLRALKSGRFKAEAKAIKDA